MYSVIIDTDKYSGNFERQMCAYITGIVGDCCVGDEEAAIALKELGLHTIGWFDENLFQEPDEHGVLRPCAIRSTLGWFNDGMGNHWKDGTDMEEVKQKKIETITSYYEPHIEAAKREIGNGQTQWESDLEGYKKQIETVKTIDVIKHDAYQSVAIFFSDLPPDNIIKIIKERAAKFVETKDINISRFRLIRTETIEHEEVI